MGGKRKKDTPAALRRSARQRGGSTPTTPCRDETMRREAERGSIPPSAEGGDLAGEVATLAKSSSGGDPSSIRGSHSRSARKSVTGREGEEEGGCNDDLRANDGDAEGGEREAEGGAPMEDEMSIEEKEKLMGVSAADSSRSAPMEDEMNIEEEEKLVGVSAADSSLYDVLDYHLEMTVAAESTEARGEHWEAVAMYSWLFQERHENYNKANNTKYGRLYSRLNIANAVMVLTATPSYGSGCDSMVYWGERKWTKLGNQLTAVKAAGCRRDRNEEVVLGGSAIEDDTELPDLAKERCFSTDMEKALDAVLINQIVSPIRVRIEKGINKEYAGAPTFKENATVVAIFERITKSESPRVRKHGMLIFRRTDGEGGRGVDDRESGSGEENSDRESGRGEDDSDTGCDNAKYEPVLRDYDELKKVMGDKPYDLDWLTSYVVKKVLLPCHEKVSKSVLRNMEYAVRDQAVEMGKTRMRMPRSQGASGQGGGEMQSRHQQGLSDLRQRGRRAIAGEDPQDGKEREVNRAARGRGRALQLLKESSSESSSDSDSDEDTGKSAICKQRTLERWGGGKASCATGLAHASGCPTVIPGKYKGPPPDSDRFTPDGRVTGKTAYTKTEVNCILQAIETHPDYCRVEELPEGKLSIHGNYVEIKNLFKKKLKNRTSVQIKDKVRTLLKSRGEGEKLWRILYNRPGGPAGPPDDGEEEEDNHQSKNARDESEEEKEDET